MLSFAEAKSFAVAPAQAPVRCGRIGIVGGSESGRIAISGSNPGNSKGNPSWCYMTSLCIIVCICICVGQKVSMKKNPTFDIRYIYIYQSIMKHRNP